MKRFAILLAMAATVSTLSACATGRWESRELVDSRNIRISLEQRVENDQIVEQKFNQPAKIEPAVFRTVLGDLYYLSAPEFFGNPEEQQIFQPEEIERLAPEMAAALLEASSNQRVRFVSYNKGGGLIFKDRRKTSGILFIDAENRFNIAFSYINRIIDFDERNIDHTATDPEPLAIESSESSVIAKAPYLGHHMLAEGKPSPVWVKADLDEIRAAIESPPAPAAPPETREKASEEGRQAPSSGPAPVPGDWENRKEAHKTKLEYLKELYEDGLITKDEYEAKKQELLDQIR